MRKKRTSYPKPFGWVFALARYEEGGAAVEYASLLVLLASVAFGVAMVSRHVQESFASVDASGVGNTQRQVAERVAEPSPHAAWTVAHGGRVGRSTQPMRIEVWLLFGCIIGLAIGVAGWHIFRRQQVRPVPALVPEQKNDVGLPAHLRARLYAKRQDIFNLLFDDLGMVLHGQLEVRHVMTDASVIVSADTPMEDLRRLMKVKTVRHLMVCEADNQLLGVISDRDLASRPGLFAKEVMTPDPITVTPDTPVVRAVTPLLREGFSCLPVTEEGRLCGVITTTDLIMTMQCTLQLLEQTAEALRADPQNPVSSVEQTSSSVCEETAACVG